MSIEHYTYFGAAYLFLIENEQILLLHRYNTGFQDGKYAVPAGHLDGGETAREGCAREAKEEVGITINPTDLQVVHVMHRKKANHESRERIDFFMTTSRYQGEPSNCEPNKHDRLEWHRLDALPENMVDYMRVALTHYRDGVWYSEYGW